MPNFTMSLEWVIDYAGGDIETGDDGITRLVGCDYKAIGLASYPIFDEGHREILNGKIIDHYINREIGMETIGMFRLAVRRRMNEIMPFYNQLYKSELIKYDPLSTVNLSNKGKTDTTQESDAETSNESDATNSAKSRTVNSDTPQTMLAGNADYATSGTDSGSTGDVRSTSSQSSTDKVTGEATSDNETTGYQGIPAQIIMATREAFLNIDLRVINELEDCFMLVWNTGDSYTQGRYYY